MKKLITVFTLALIAACPLAGFGEDSIEKDPAYLPIDKVLDLKAIPPQVNVNLPRFLLKDALAGLNDSTNSSLSKSGNDLADMLKDVKLIRVVVIEGNQTNRAALNKAMKALQAEIDAGKWTSIVSVPDKEDNVGIYAMPDPAGETMAGVAVLVHSGQEAVICNIVGHVSIGKLMKLASTKNMLPKELLQKLQGGGQSHEESDEKKEKMDSGAATNQPADPPQTAKDSGTK